MITRTLILYFVKLAFAFATLVVFWLSVHKSMEQSAEDQPFNMTFMFYLYFTGLESKSGENIHNVAANWDTKCKRVLYCEHMCARALACRIDPFVKR